LSACLARFAAQPTIGSNNSSGPRAHTTSTIAAPDDYNDQHDYLRRDDTVDTDLWTVAEAKAKLSRVIEHAQKRGPQTITRNGRRAVVVVDAEEWERRTRRAGTLADFFAVSPLRGSRLRIQRSRDRLRQTDL
jgi:prevent-host-death family protein